MATHWEHYASYNTTDDAAGLIDIAQTLENLADGEDQMHWMAESLVGIGQRLNRLNTIYPFPDPVPEHWEHDSTASLIGWASQVRAAEARAAVARTGRNEEIRRAVVGGRKKTEVAKIVGLTKAMVGQIVNEKGKEAT